MASRNYRTPSAHILRFQFTFAPNVGHQVTIAQPHEVAHELRAYLKSLMRATAPKKRTSRIQGRLYAMVRASGSSTERIKQHLASCCTSLDALIKPRGKPDEDAVRLWAEGFLLRYLVLSGRSDAILFVESVVRHALEVDHQPFPFALVFAPGVRQSIPPHHEELIPPLLKGVLVDLLNQWPHDESVDLPELVARIKGAGGDGAREELVSCNIALGKLLDPLDEPDPKTLQRRIEAFLDDYLILKPENSKRFMDEAAQYAMEQIELRRTIQQKADLGSTRPKKRAR